MAKRIGMFLDKASKKQYFSGLTGVLLMWSVSSMAGTPSARLVIELPNSIDFASTRVLYQGDDATSFATYNAKTVTLTVPFPDIDGQQTVRVINDETGHVIAAKSFSLTNGAIISADSSETQPPSVTDQHQTNNADADTDLEKTSQPAPYSINISGQLDLSGLGSMEDGSDYAARESEQDGESDLLATFKYRKHKRYFSLSPALFSRPSCLPSHSISQSFARFDCKLAQIGPWRRHSPEIFFKFALPGTLQTIPPLPARRLDACVAKIELEFTQTTQTAALDSMAILPPAVDYKSALLPRVTISA